MLGGLLFPKFAGKRAGFFTILASIACIITWSLFPAIGKVFFNQIGFYMLVVCGIVFIAVSLLDKEKVA